MTKTTEKQRKLKNGNPSGSGFKPGQSGNPNGRAPKYITTVTDKTGYRNSEIQDCMKSMLRMTLDEISEIQNSKDTPILEKLLAAGIQSDLQKGELRNLESILNRSYGKPKEFVEVEQVDKHKELTKEEIEIEGVKRFGIERWERMKNAMYDK
jgi:hypothetical protein